MADPILKLCGLTDAEAVETAVEAGADLLGFVFYPKSPRCVDPAEVAEWLEDLPEDVRIVGLFVDPSDDDINTVMQHVRLDYLQLHGSETPERVEALRLDFAVEVIKALGVRDAADLEAAKPFLGVADMLLFDAKPPAGSDRPGGNAVSFDWSLMDAWTDTTTPWLLAGGLTPETVADALRQTKAPGVDVSSGVERAPGEKDPAKIRAFIAAALEA